MAVKKTVNTMHPVMIYKASHDICIFRFCCQEICPEKAMILK